MSASSKLVTVQFLIERCCPIVATTAQIELLEKFLPHDAWVYLEIGVQGPPCGGKTWLITEDSFRDNCERIGLPRDTPYNRNNYVCEHMGHLIE